MVMVARLKSVSLMDNQLHGLQKVIEMIIYNRDQAEQEVVANKEIW